MVAFLVTLIILWGESFDKGKGNFVSCERNPSEVSFLKVDETGRYGIVSIRGTPSEIGRSCAWIYFEEPLKIKESHSLVLTLRGNGRKIRVRVYFLKDGRLPYYAVEKTVETSKEWERLEIPFSEGLPIWSSNFPMALVPGRRPPIFLFIDNGEPGPFEVYLDEIAVEGE